MSIIEWFNIHKVDEGSSTEHWMAETADMVVETDPGGAIHMYRAGSPGSDETQGNDANGDYTSRELIEHTRWLHCRYKDVFVYFVREEPTPECPQGRLRVMITDRIIGP